MAKQKNPEAYSARIVISILIIILALFGGNIGKVGVILGALVILFMSLAEKEQASGKK